MQLTKIAKNICTKTKTSCQMVKGIEVSILFALHLLGNKSEWAKLNRFVTGLKIARIYMIMPARVADVVGFQFTGQDKTEEALKFSSKLKALILSTSSFFNLGVTLEFFPKTYLSEVQQFSKWVGSLGGGMTAFARGRKAFLVGRSGEYTSPLLDCGKHTLHTVGAVISLLGGSPAWSLYSSVAAHTCFGVPKVIYRATRVPN